jgi:hypothetical protein
MLRSISATSAQHRHVGGDRHRQLMQHIFIEAFVIQAS